MAFVIGAGRGVWLVWPWLRHNINRTKTMRKLLVAAACGIAVGVLSGCSTYAVPRYSISADNVVALKRIGTNIGVGAFTQTPVANQDPSSIMCRGVGPIKTPDGEPFAEFIRSALVSELKIAGTYGTHPAASM